MLLTRKSIADILTMLFYAGATFFILTRHEPWRDEAQTWLIVHNVHSFGEFWMKLRYEQHPPLWYLVLLPFAKAGLPYFTQHVIHWLLAVAASAVFLIKAPFSRVFKTIFIFSYYMFFEYAVIARNYTPGILLLFVIAAMYPHRFRYPLTFSLLVAGIFLSHALLFTAALTLAGVYFAETIMARQLSTRRSLAIVFMLAGGVIAFALGFFIPHDHISYQQIMTPDYLNAFTAMGRALFPTYRDVSLWLGAVIGVIVFFAACLSLLNRPAVLLTAIGSFSGIIYILIFRNYGHLRHHGTLLVILLFLLWIATYYGEKTVPFLKKLASFGAHQGRRFVLGALTCCLLLGIKYSVESSILEITKNFSGAKLMAEAITELSPRFHWEDQVIIGHPSNHAASVAVYLPQRTFWYSDLQEYGTYFMQRPQTDSQNQLTRMEILQRAEKVFPNLTQIFFLVSRPFDFTTYKNYELKLIFKADENIWGYSYERFYLYKAIPVR